MLEQELKELGAQLRAKPNPVERSPEFTLFCRRAWQLGDLILAKFRRTLGEAQVHELLVDWMSVHYEKLVRADNPVALLQSCLPRAVASWLRRPISKLEKSDKSQEEPRPAESPSGAEDRVHDQLLASQKLDQMLKELSELPAIDREVFIACAIRGEEYADVADRLGLSVELVYQKLSRARRRVKGDES